MVDLQTWIFDLEDIGFFDIFLPFLLIFSVSFAVLQNTKILGKDSKNINTIVALILAFFFIQSNELILIIRSFLPNISLIFIVLIMMLFIMAIFMGERFEGFASWGAVGASIIALILVIIALTSDFIAGPSWFDTFLFREDITVLVPLIIIIILIFWVTSGGTGRTGGTLGEDLAKMLGYKRRSS